MADTPLHHPEKDELVAFGLGKLAPDEATEIEVHLGQCEACCETLLDLQDDTFVSLVRRSPEPKRGELDADIQATVDSDPGVAGQPATMAELPDELRYHQRYEILELVGRGGMGDVYKAQHKVMNRAVALKVIRPELVQNAAAVDRFQREVQTAARLHHGNIVTAHDADQAGDVHFLVMEFVDGVDLSQVVQERGPLPVAEACDYIRQAATGLEHARQLGMVHRDIKPHNLMLTLGQASSLLNEASGKQDAFPTVKILDFGLANFVSEVAAEGLSGDASAGTGGTIRSHQQLTQLGTMMGTPDYIAPEQAADACTADIRSDIYSLGCTLTFLLTGRPLFEGASVTDKLKSHAEQQPPKLINTRGDIPPELQPVVDRMLAKDPGKRFQTPAEVAEALALFVAPAAPPPRRRSRTLVPTALVGAAILLAGLIVIATGRGRLEIQSEVDDVQVSVEQGGEQVAILDLKTGSQVKWLPTGDYELKLKGGDENGVTLDQRGFTMSRLGKVIVTARWNTEGRGLTDASETALGDASTLAADLPDWAMSETVTTGYNGGFEVTKSGLPVSWSFYTPRTVPNGDFDILMDKTDAKEGEQSLKFVVRKCESTGGRLSPGFFNEFRIANFSPPGSFETKPGETYKISFWAKNAGSEFVFKARGVSAKKGDPGVVIRSKETFNEWRRFECTYTIPPQMWLRLELNVVQPGTFWIDDLQIVKLNDKEMPPAAATSEVDPFLPKLDPLSLDWLKKHGNTIPFQMTEATGVAVLSFGNWRLVFEGVPVEPSNNPALFTGILNFALPGTNASGSSGPGGSRGVTVTQKWNAQGNDVSVNSVGFKLLVRGMALDFGDQTYEATAGVQTILIGKDGKTRLQPAAITRQTPPPQRAGLLTNPPKLPEGGLPVGKNLIVDSSLEDTPTGGMPKGWFAWLDDGPDFKCEAVEGGVTGKHCLQISGTGTRGVVFATSIPLDRTKRYALKGRVKVEGEAGTWAVVKLNYFNNTSWLGVDDRVGVTTSDLDWKLYEKTDMAERYPTATLIVPTCHIEGNGTAWFDDLEVIAYDRDKLPENFDARHGKNNRMK